MGSQTRAGVMGSQMGSWGVMGSQIGSFFGLSGLHMDTLDADGTHMG